MCPILSEYLGGCSWQCDIVQARQNTKDLFIVSADDAVNSFDQLDNQEPDINEILSDDFERLLFVGTSSGVRKITRTKKRVKNFFLAKSCSRVESLRGIVELPDSFIMIADRNGWYL